MFLKNKSNIFVNIFVNKNNNKKEIVLLKEGDCQETLVSYNSDDKIDDFIYFYDDKSLGSNWREVERQETVGFLRGALGLELRFRQMHITFLFRKKKR